MNKPAKQIIIGFFCSIFLYKQITFVSPRHRIAKVNSSFISSIQRVPNSSACFLVPDKNSHAAMRLKQKSSTTIHQWTLHKKFRSGTLKYQVFKPSNSAYVANAHPPIVTTNTPVTFGRPRGGAIPAFLAAAHFPILKKKLVIAVMYLFFYLI